MTEKTTRERIGDLTAPVVPQHPAIASWRPATSDDLDAITELVQAADRVDHPSWLTPREDVAEAFESSWTDPALDTLVGFDVDGRLRAVGAVQIHPARDTHLHAYLNGRVHPDARGLGIGRQLLRWEHERALEALAELDSPLPAAVMLYVEEADTAARSLGERRSLSIERWFTTMVRDLAAPVPEIEPRTDAASPAFELVPYDASRKEATRLARNNAFRDHWGSLESPVERWSQFVDGPFLRPDLSWLVIERTEDGEQIVAFALGSVNEADWEPQGYTSVYVDLIGVTRERRGRRLAPAVITAQLRAAQAAGLEKAVLDVDTESPTGANDLYGKLGFEPTERTLVLVSRY